MEGAVDIARRMGLPLVATSDAHYVNREDAEAQDVLLCINTGKFRTDTNRMRMEGNEFYLRSPDEMYAAFPGLEDAVARSQEIADSVDIDLELGKRHFPASRRRHGKSPNDFLRELVPGRASGALCRATGAIAPMAVLADGRHRAARRASST